MSFILDALKKSETDRQSHSTAEFSGVPTRPQTQSVPRWLWLVAALLAVNLVVLVGLLLRPDAAPQVASSEQSPAVVATTAAARPAAIESAPAQSTPAISTPTTSSFSEQVAAAAQNPPDRQTAAPAPATRQPAASNIVTPVLISQDAASIPASSIYPTYQEVLARGHLDLPPMHLDIHVFSPSAKDRFAFVNMSKLREGSTMAEGPEVAEITPDGVVLRHEGQLFLLPRE